LTENLYICRVDLVKPASDIRISPQTLRVLEAFVEEPAVWRYGYDLSKETRLKSGTLYPVLMRLAERRLLETRWEAAEPGRPPRHMYRLTTRGAEFARAKLREARPKRATARPALSGSSPLTDMGL
jgi:PadR family transcriptional regulator